MPLPVKDYSSIQASALPCAGTAGYGIALLDACLVTGFNSKTVSSLTVAANVATVTTTTNHGLAVGDPIAIAGANEAVFNDEFRVASVPSSTAFTFAVITSTTPATGSLSCKIPALGWEKAFTGTNKAVYRSQDVTGARLYLRVDDSNAQYMAVNLYETMSGVDTGTGASTTLYWKKSSTSDTTARPWQLVGDSKIFYLFTDWNATYTLQPNGYAFGDLLTAKAGDAYHCMIIGHTTSAPASAFTNNHFNINRGSANTTGLLLARSFSQLGAAVGFYKESAPASTAMGYGSATIFPNQSDNGVHLTPVYVVESATNAYRGRLPGLLVPFETTYGAFPAMDKTVVIGGKTHLAIKLVALANNTYGNVWFNLDEAWA